MRSPADAARVPVRAFYRVRERVEAAHEDRRRVPWPAPAASHQTRLAAVVVNYNTVHMTAQLVFSLLRVLEPGLLRRIVVVDNASKDDVTGLLPAMHEADLITLLRGRRANPHHGPGLNVGLSYLATQQHDEAQAVDYVWVLDSDVIALRPGAAQGGIRAMHDVGSPLAGEVRPTHPIFPGYAHVSCLVMDPAVLWQDRFPPFQPNDEPGIAMQAAMQAQGVATADFPFYSDRYLLHLGRGTSFAVRTMKDRLNRNYRWSRTQTGHHFERVSDGPRLYRAFWETFSEEVPTPDPELYVEACRRSERLTFT